MIRPATENDFSIITLIEKRVFRFPWSNNQIKATPHRVKGSKKERISIPLFFNPNYYTDISPANSTIKITAGEYLTKRFNETYTHLQKK